MLGNTLLALTRVAPPLPLLANILEAFKCQVALESLSLVSVKVSQFFTLCSFGLGEIVLLFLIASVFMFGFTLYASR